MTNKAVDSPAIRLDKWLWAARFYKTRSLAVDEINKGRVAVNEQPAKPGRELKVGDQVQLRQGQVPRTVQVLGISHTRGPALAVGLDARHIAVWTDLAFAGGFRDRQHRHKRR